ncbi:MAG: hypothetical protein RL653_3205 [Pseudomonadota bacterium]|jgi:hypothetical protein
MTQLRTAEDAVLRDPWPDAPRLAYAAAVAATDPDRARGIRAEIALLEAKRAGRAGHTPDAGLIPSLKAHAHVVFEPLLEDLFPPGDDAHCYGLGRGFPEQIFTSAGWLLEHAPVLLARVPVLDLYVGGLAGHVEAFFDSPWLARIRSLDLSENGLGDRDVERIAASPHLGRLRALELSFNRVDTAGLDALATSPNLPQLRYLGFRANRAPDPNPRVEYYEEGEQFPIPTADMAAFLARHPGCRFIGRVPVNEYPGLLQDAAGGPIP